MNKLHWLIACFFLILQSLPARAQLSFQLEMIPNPYQAPKGTRAILVNGDGSHVVVYGKKVDEHDDKIPMAFHWSERDGHTHLGLLNNRNVLLPMDISDDGKVIVGHNGGASFVWTKQQQMRTVPKLKSHYINTAISISADGKTVVGYTGWQSDIRAFRWEIGKSLQEIGTGKDKVKWRNATYSSEDASVIVGSTPGQVYVWKSDNTITPIIAPEDCHFIAEDVSHDGHTIGGRCSIDTPMVWNEFNGFSTLPIPAEAATAMITAMSGDGTKFLGSAKYKGENYIDTYRPILWHQKQIYFLDDIVKQLNANKAMKRVTISNISSNGKVIVGGYKDSIDRYYPFKLMIKE